MNETLIWLEKLSQVGFPTLLGLLLFGNYTGIWIWGKQHREKCADLEADLSKVEAEKNEWKEMALRLLSVGEDITRKVKRG